MENIRGAILMSLAMLGFAIEDTLIKFLSDSIPTGQIIILLGLGGSLFFGTLAIAKGDRLLHPDFNKRPFQIRLLGEFLGVLGFVTAIALMPLSTASAILQATPLAVTLGAALFLGETVGWRRWLAIIIGLIGVLLIIRPGTADFDMTSCAALVGVFGLAARDLATRRITAEISSRIIALSGFAIVIPAGLIFLAFGLNGSQWHPMARSDLLVLLSTLVAGVSAYYGIVMATRIGEMSVIAPYRYTRLVFAMILGMIVFQERPDALTLLGAAIIVASGIYTLWREARLMQTSKPPSTTV